MTDERRLRELAEAPEPRLGGLGPTVLSLQGVEGVTEVLLIRHAQTPPSEPTEDVSLTDVGREQAEALGASLASRRLDAVISSPTRRCQETAATVARHHGLAVETDRDLREVEAYAPGGETLRQKLDDAAWQKMRSRMRRERRWDIRGEYGESSDSLRRRATTAVEAAIAPHPGGRVALVSHGPTINAYLAQIMGSPHDLLFLSRLTSVCVVWAKDDRRDLRLLNGMGHFATL